MEEQNKKLQEIEAQIKKLQAEAAAIRNESPKYNLELPICYTNAKDIGFKLWSNVAGNLFNPNILGKDGISKSADISELPNELQKAFMNLLNVGSGSFEYLVEFGGEYFIWIVAEFHKDFCRENEIAFANAFWKIGSIGQYMKGTHYFSHSYETLGFASGYEGCHELGFLVPWNTADSTFHEIERLMENSYSRLKL